jgi:hypothetical protein
MFGLLAALNFLPKQREGREALNYENYIRTGQGLPSTKIYRESSVDKQARKQLAAIRYKERLQQQVKFIRLMKKLLIKVDHETLNGEIDEELEQMRIKIAQLEIKVEKSARAKDINCEDMFDMNKPDDAYDIQLEQIIRTATSNIGNEKFKQDDKASGDNVNTQVLYMINNNPYNHGDQFLDERIGKKNEINCQ